MAERRRVATVALVVALVTAAAGAAAGWLWEAVWTPPSGVAYQGRFVLDGQGVGDDFAGTGLFVVIGVLVGLVVALVVTLGSSGDELLTVVGLLAGAVLGSFLMWRVGTLLGPADPTALARSAPDLQPLVADLRVHGRAAYAALPAGTMLGATLVYLLHRRTPDSLHRRDRMSGRTESG